MRPSTEAMVLHAWYLDLWDCGSDDPVVWNVTTLRRLVLLVEQDRKHVQLEENQQVRSNCRNIH